MYFERFFDGWTRSRRWVWSSQGIEKRRKKFLRADMGKFAPIAKDKLGFHRSICYRSCSAWLRCNRISYASKKGA